MHRAMAYLLHERATIVEAVPGVVIRSATAEFTVPRVVQFREMVRVPYRYRAQAFSSKALFQRDLTCAYCGCDRPDTVDHIIPKSQGGPLTFLNCVAACKRCNNKKANRTPAQRECRCCTSRGRSAKGTPSSWRSPRQARTWDCSDWPEPAGCAMNAPRRRPAPDTRMAAELRPGLSACLKSERPAVRIRELPL